MSNDTPPPPESYWERQERRRRASLAILTNPPIPSPSHSQRRKPGSFPIWPRAGLTSFPPMRSMPELKQAFGTEKPCLMPLGRSKLLCGQLNQGHPASDVINHSEVGDRIGYRRSSRGRNAASSVGVAACRHQDFSPPKRIIIAPTRNRLRLCFHPVRDVAKARAACGSLIGSATTSLAPAFSNSSRVPYPQSTPRESMLFARAPIMSCRRSPTITQNFGFRACRSTM